MFIYLDVFIPLKSLIKKIGGIYAVMIIIIIIIMVVLVFIEYDSSIFEFFILIEVGFAIKKLFATINMAVIFWLLTPLFSFGIREITNMNKTMIPLIKIITTIILSHGLIPTKNISLDISRQIERIKITYCIWFFISMV